MCARVCSGVLEVCSVGSILCSGVCSRCARVCSGGEFANTLKDFFALRAKVYKCARACVESAKTLKIFFALRACVHVSACVCVCECM